MEEQRARQEAENAASGGGETEGATPAIVTEDEDPVLARALAMSVGESAAAEPDLSAMTEDEQIAYAMRMSMQDEAAAAAAESSEKMDVDDSSTGDKNDEDYSEAMNDPAFLQVSNIVQE